MRVLIAFDKFKDALPAARACEVAVATLGAAHPDWEFDVCPLTDGGEAFCETLCGPRSDRIDTLTVQGPRLAPVTAPVGFVEVARLPAAATALLPGVTGRIAVVGLASASGIELLVPELRDPWHTTSVGTGELIRHATSCGASAILLGLGGSAINDLGLGALSALGVNGRDAWGQAIDVPTPSRWTQIVDFDGQAIVPPIFIACDVTNPLLGPYGATATFGPQKGLAARDVPVLENLAIRVAAQLCRHAGKSIAFAETPGAGAAGGVGFGLMVAAGARLVPGFELVSAWLDLPARIAAADLIITGEGRFDATSLGGKGPGSLVRTAEKLGRRAHVFAGSLGVPPSEQLHAISPPDLPLAEALPRTAELLAAALQQHLPAS